MMRSPCRNCQWPGSHQPVSVTPVAARDVTNMSMGWPLRLERTSGGEHKILMDAEMIVNANSFNGAHFMITSTSQELVQLIEPSCMHSIAVCLPRDQLR
ncbi:hypothetical protein E2C01_086377 [Portunus trituberculatus]|uniref:Uncharacterized protein n=1 Tax=Portunus trituberculatus TaxID=210409 RepID=A0A5B7JEF4_PORTR|nr:hypothetical protein [Portunus trituberculatus]